MELYTEERKNRRCLESNCVSCAHVWRFISFVGCSPEPKVMPMNFPRASRCAFAISGSVLVELHIVAKFSLQTDWDMVWSCDMPFEFIMNLHERSHFVLFAQFLFFRLFLISFARFTLSFALNKIYPTRTVHTHTHREVNVMKTPFWPGRFKNLLNFATLFQLHEMIRSDCLVCCLIRLWLLIFPWTSGDSEAEFFNEMYVSIGRDGENLIKQSLRSKLASQ